MIFYLKAKGKKQTKTPTPILGKEAFLNVVIWEWATVV